MDHSITVGGKQYSLALAPRDLRELREKHGVDLLNIDGEKFGAACRNADFLLAATVLAVRPRGSVTSDQIDDGIDASDLSTVVAMMLDTVERFAKPITDRTSANPTSPSSPSAVSS